MRPSHTLTQTLTLILALVLAPAGVCAQTGEARTKETGPKVFCDPSRAAALVREQLSEAKSLDSAARRISLMTRAADLLWIRERQSARDIFTEAYDLAVKDFRQQEKGPKPENGVMVPKVDQRFAVMSAIARRDPARARSLAESVAEEKRREAEKGADRAGDERGRAGAAGNTPEPAQAGLPVHRGAALPLARGRGAGAVAQVARDARAAVRAAEPVAAGARTRAQSRGRRRRVRALTRRRGELRAVRARIRRRGDVRPRLRECRERERPREA